MTDYHNGLIYKLCSKDTDITDIYIGSTTSFKRRKSEHKSNCNNEKNYKYNRDVYKFIRVNGGFSNWDMVLIEYYPCDNKLELEKKEREVIENLKPTLNKFIPTRSKKEYRQINKQQISEKFKDYYNDNKEKIKKQSNEYYKDNKQQILEKRKDYQEKNKKKISEKNKEKITCECGAIITKSHFVRHTKSIKHQGYIVLKKNLNNI